MAAQPDIASSDCYKILGVERGASDAEVAKAYKRLALRYHPDKNPTDKAKAEEAFKKLSEAYSVLGDPEQRRNYDLLGGPEAREGAVDPGRAGAVRGGGGRGGMSVEEAERIVHAFFGGDDDAGRGDWSGLVLGRKKGGDDLAGDLPFMVNDMFSSFFGGHGGGGAAQTTRATGAGSRRRRAGSSGGCVQRTTAGGPPAPAHAMPTGTRVILGGLEKAPEHNAKVGRVAAFDAERSRYEVELAGGGGSLSLRPQNLTQRCEVEIRGLGSRPELNGRTGEIVGYDRGIGRYMVSLPGSASAMALRRENCLLNVGTRVRLCELADERYSGQMARIAAVDRDAERYVLRCQNGDEIKVRYDEAVC